MSGTASTENEKKNSGEKRKRPSKKKAKYQEPSEPPGRKQLRICEMFPIINLASDEEPSCSVQQSHCAGRDTSPLKMKNKKVSVKEKEDSVVCDSEIISSTLDKKKKRKRKRKRTEKNKIAFATESDSLILNRNNSTMEKKKKKKNKKKSEMMSSSSSAKKNIFDVFTEEDIELVVSNVRRRLIEGDNKSGIPSVFTSTPKATSSGNKEAVENTAMNKKNEWGSATVEKVKKRKLDSPVDLELDMGAIKENILAEARASF